MKFKKSASTVLTAALLVSGITPAYAKEKNFIDVNNSDSYAEAVYKLVDFNILSGYDDFTFKPNQHVTRAQTASIIAKALRLDLSNVKDPGFKDVSTENSHYPAIAALTEMGVFKKGENFNPNSSLTRAQMSQILVEAFDLQADNHKNFDDVKSTAWYYNYAGILGSLKITTNDKNYNPGNYVSRANLADFIKRVIDNKRNDKTKDKWDDWQGWDGSETPVKEEADAPNDKDEPKEDTQNDDDKTNAVHEELLKELERELDYAADDIKDGQKKVEKELDDLEEAYEDLDKAAKNSKEEEKAREEIDEEKDDLLEALSELDDAVLKGEKVLTKTRKENLKELKTLESVLENSIRKAKDDLDKAYANTFDKELHKEDIEDALEALEDAREDGERAIRENSFNLLVKAFEDIEEAIKDAEETYDIYEESTVDILEDEEEELAEAIDETKEVLEDVIELLEDKAEEQVDYFRDSLDDAMDELDDALDEEDKSEIYDAREKLERIIKDAKNALDRIKDTDIDSLINDAEKLESTIEKAEEELADSK